MNEEMMRILKMIEEGKISADKGKELIDMLNQQKVTTIETKKYTNQMLKVKISSNDGDKVNIQLPVVLIKEILSKTGQLPIPNNNLGGMNIEDLINTVTTCLDYSVMGDIVDITSADGDVVKITIE